MRGCLLTVQLAGDTVQTPGKCILRPCRMAICAAFILLFLIGIVSAATLTWDPVPTGAGITDGSGTWDTASLNWTADGGTTRVAWTNGDDAIIGGGSVGSAGTITIDGGGVSANSITCNLPNGGGSYTITGGTLTLTGNSVDTNAQDLKISSVIAGAAGLVKTGTGKLTASGANTYTGGTTISAGTLQIGDGGTSGKLGNGAVSDNANLVFNRTDTLTVSNLISGTGNVLQNGTGTITLTAQNSFTGATTVNAGILVGDYGSNAASGALAKTSLITVNSGGTLRAGATADNGFLGSSPSGGAILLNAGGTLDTASDSKTNHLASVTLSGGTLGGAGSLPAGSPSLACGRWALDKPITVTGGTGVSSVITANGLALTQTGGTQFNVGSSGSPDGIDLLVTGILYHYGTTGCGVDNVGFIKSGTGTMVLAGANDYVSPTTISSGSLVIGNGGTTGNLGSGTVTDNAHLIFNRSDTLTVTSAVTGTGNVFQNGTGMTTLNSTTVTYSGMITVTTGILNFSTVVPSSNVWNISFQSPSSYARMRLPDSPDLAGKTINVNLSFTNQAYNTTIISWTGSSSNTPALQMNGMDVTSGQQVNYTSLIYSIIGGVNVSAIMAPTPTPTSSQNTGSDSGSDRPGGSGPSSFAVTSPGGTPGNPLIFAFSDQLSGNAIFTIVSVRIIPTRALGPTELVVANAGTAGASQLTGRKTAGIVSIEPVGVNPSSVSEGTITFALAASWLAQNGLKPSDIVLMRYSADQWSELKTTFDRLDGDAYYFTAVTPGFSYFTVAGRTNATTAVPQATEVSATAVGEPQLSSAVTPEISPAAGMGAVPTTAVPVSMTTPEGSSGIPALAVFSVLAGMVIAGVAGFFLWRWWTRRKNPSLFRYDE